MKKANMDEKELVRDALECLPQIAYETGADFKKLEDHFRKQNIYLVTDFNIPFLRFKRDVSNIEKGTMVFLTCCTAAGHKKVTFMRGFPKMRRLMVLKQGLEKQFPKGKFCVEEKMNGYHIRTALVDGDFIAATRGGLPCAYTTYQVEEHLGKKRMRFFKDNPKLMVCGEAVGIQNPYQEKSYPEAKEFGYFVFDIRDRKTNVSLSIIEKERLIKKYNLPAVKSFGQFTAKQHVKIAKIVRDLGAKGREGVVIKSPDMSKQLKYTANQSTNTDLDYAFKFMFDYGQAFFFRRLIREAFQAYELGLKGAELQKEATALGKSLMYPMIDTIKKIESGKEVTEDFDITVPNKEFGDAFVIHLNHLGVKATIRDVKKTKQGYVFKLSRHYPATNDKVKAYLSGEFCEE